MDKTSCTSGDRGNISRRGFLRVGSLAPLGIGLSQYLRASRALAAKGTPLKGKAQACILLWLEGGPSQMDTWDPKGNSTLKRIATRVPGIQISELFPRIARQMNKLSVIRSVHTEENNHPQGTYNTLTGHRPIAAMKFPSLGSIICKETGPRNELPQYALVPQPSEVDFFTYADAYNAAFIGANYNPMIVPDPSQPDFHIPDLRLPKTVTADTIEHRQSFLKVVDRLYREKEEQAEFDTMDALSRQALGMLLSPKVEKAFDLSKEPDKLREAYGRNRVGQSVLLARRLIESGCRFVSASGYRHGQWDTHGKNEETLRKDLAPLLDQTLPVLLEDLEARGLLQSTVVLVMGEFGRTPTINPQLGRDHWPDCWSLLIGGGGIEGGHVIGASDKRAAYVADRMVSMGDLFATIYKAFGIDWTKTYMTPIGRPIYIANALGDKQGEPIKELV
ncbi:MAG TPA: DUF1501 domain-containing protein [Gemmataceae bacterium]|nr:DUF1501 domain-containing protein [Gemmataceae bacterium]